jgi:hypothetical protein
MQRILELAKFAGLKANSETALSPNEQKFAEALIKECGKFTDATTRNFMFQHFGVK